MLITDGFYSKACYIFTVNVNVDSFYYSHEHI